ncbi:hypothetical protein [Neorhodopirellula pilleata]|uniref:Uncharacterized protein n=1 Tax=Neorhodopirellula pilleata TaxID=2714738 RepID=A0A5C6AR58_9BACT|nr:hypothetical protein [Neorhodopirellula pilleata]TWU01709.1 hypothetical protein Pla100_14440 [Neorhodopirellula pilleata]
MTNTLATRKQSEAIRARMQQIRSDLPYDVDMARQQVRQMTDWKYQFRQHPVAVMATVAIAGYLLVPQSRKRSEVIVRNVGGNSTTEAKAAKRGLLSGLVAAAATMALRSGTSLFAQHLSQSFMQAPSRTSVMNDAHPPTVGGIHSTSEALS